MGRTRHGPRDRRVRLALVVACGLLIPAGAASATSAFAQQPDPVAQADQAVAEADGAVADAQARVDQVAGAYFRSLERARQLDARISDLEGRIDETRQEVARLEEVTADRAVAAYKRSGNSLEGVILDTSEVTDVGRRIKLLDSLNTRDEQVARQLRRSQDELSSEQAELEAAREEQSNAVARLKEEEQRVNAELVAAQARRQAAVDEQLRAQQQAAAEAAAAQAAAEAAAAEAAAAQAAAAAPPTAPPNPAPAPSPEARNIAPVPVPAKAAPANNGVHPHHNDPYLTCVRHYESTDNYQAYNPAGPAYGAYQFLQPTWNLAANHAGRGDLVGVDPRRASAYDQDEMAWVTYQWQGKRPWSVDPC